MRHGVSALLLLLVLSLGASARASGDAAELSLNAQAVTRGQGGLEAFREGKWQAAYASFHEAETLVHSPVFLLYMARARAQQGANSEALDLYARVVSEPVFDTTPDAWKQAVAQAASEREALLARVATQATEHARLASAPISPGATNGRTRTTAMRPQRHGAAVIASGTIGAAGLVLGITTGVVALVKFRRIDARCGPHGCNRADKQEYDDVMTWTRLADVGFAVAGAGLATAAVFLWVVPTQGAGPETAGLSVRGSF